MVYRQIHVQLPEPENAAGAFISIRKEIGHPKAIGWQTAFARAELALRPCEPPIPCRPTILRTRHCIPKRPDERFCRIRLVRGHKWQKGLTPTWPRSKTVDSLDPSGTSGYDLVDARWI